jgi:hypothetical protein
MKQFLNFSDGAKNITIHAEVGDVEQFRSFQAMRKLFALKNAHHPAIARLRAGDKKFWAEVVRFRAHERAKIEAAKAKEETQNDDTATD